MTASSRLSFINAYLSILPRQDALVFFHGVKMGYRNGLIKEL